MLLLIFFQKSKKQQFTKPFWDVSAMGQQSVQNSSNTEHVLGVSGPKNFWEDFESWKQFIYWQIS